MDEATDSENKEVVCYEELSEESSLFRSFKVAEGESEAMLEPREETEEKKGRKGDKD